MVVVIVKATNGPRYVVGCRRQLDKTKLKAGTRVALDMTTLTIMRSVLRLIITVTITVIILCNNDDDKCAYFITFVFCSRDIGLNPYHDII